MLIAKDEYVDVGGEELILLTSCSLRHELALGQEALQCIWGCGRVEMSACYEETR